jgi:hypothetical protein
VRARLQRRHRGRELAQRRHGIGSARLLRERVNTRRSAAVCGC